MEASRPAAPSAMIPEEGDYSSAEEGECSGNSAPATPDARRKHSYPAQSALIDRNSIARSETV